MKKPRSAIPAATRERVLAEYRHRCAICGGDKPQVHHIDENPTNNDILNLPPLCPNCHLTDQHNPTEPVSPLKLGIFRRYKDPTILSPQFHPIFSRLSFLYASVEPTDAWALQANGNELVEFVAAFEMGDFYSRRIKALFDMSPVLQFIALNYANADSDPRAKDEEAAYIRKVLEAREQVVAYCVELLRYQRWHRPENWSCRAP
jgi:hypothetical protein